MNRLLIPHNSDDSLRLSNRCDNCGDPLLVDHVWEGKIVCTDCYNMLEEQKLMKEYECEHCTKPAEKLIPVKGDYKICINCFENAN